MIQNEVEITGLVEDVSVHIEETGFTVLELENDGEYVTVVGVLPEVAVGERLTVRGEFATHPVYGQQFKARSFTRSLPSSAEDLYKYLAAGTIKGIGAATARKIIDAFGEDSFDVLEHDPNRLSTIRGISREKAYAICNEFTKQFAVRQTLIALERYGMNARECLNAYRVFGINAVETVQNNPYLLCSEKIGINFERADAIAQAMPDYAPGEQRTRAGILHTLRHNLGNGHTCAPREKLLPLAADFLQTELSAVQDAADGLIADGQLTAETFNGKEFLFLPQIHRAEQRAAQRIKVLCSFPPA
ncbi:MAG: ATP-dependent RecD-like DNA helicase, partial [Clostridia bacterium]|nr:ATP-dependent RecD-like DNA helicase [Clostridia bacterium]